MQRSIFGFTTFLVAITAIVSSPAGGEVARGTDSLSREMADDSWTLASPSGEISMTVELAAGSLHYSVIRNGMLVVQDSDLGLQRSDGTFALGLTLVSASAPSVIDESYTLVHGKSSQVRNYANERVLEFRNSAAKRIQLIVRAYDDGVAFRYRFPETSGTLRTVTEEYTSFHIAADGRAVIQPAWSETLHDIVPTEDPPSGVGGWGLPALFDLGHSWVMLAESDLDESYCGAWLDTGEEPREYRIKFPDLYYGEREPKWTLPWEMPWRVIIVGADVGRILESNLVSHLADASRISDPSWITPGRVSWHWWSGAPVGLMPVLKNYVNLAQSMSWEYSLVDADWDDYHSDEAMQGLVDYAADRGVGVFLWYNAAGPWNSYPYSPRDKMWDPSIRRAEMAKLVSWGVKGIKVDFFVSEKQIMIQHYLDVLEDAAAYGLLVCFHGSTPPKGWSRTWPHMMTTEAVRGAEYYKIDSMFPADAPLHNVEVAFTRNVVGPMDYTPVTFSDNWYPHLTTNAHELALSVVFESGLVHLADRISSYQTQPPEVQDFLRELPAAWDEIRFLEGDPSGYIVLARRKGAIWYLGGINGTDSPRQVNIDLVQFGYTGEGGSCIRDGATARTFISETISAAELDITMSPLGGFVAHFPTEAVDVPTDDPAANASTVARPVLDRIQPNPFTAGTRITYTVPRAARTRLAIYDTSGRRIRTLENAVRAAGHYDLFWDGTDDGGTAVAAGVYFCRLMADGQSATERLQRIR